MLLVTILVLTTIIELFGFIQISAQSLQKEAESGYWSLIRHNVKNLKKFFSKGLLLLIIYIGFMIPFTGSGTPISHLQEIKVPNFIMSVIETTPLYLGIYLAIFGVIAVLGFYLMFTLHFMSLLNQNPLTAMKNSIALVRKNTKKLVFDFIFLAIIIFVVITLLIAGWLVFIAYIAHQENFNNPFGYVLLVFLLMCQYLGVELGKLIFVPFETLHLTKLFY